MSTPPSWFRHDADARLDPKVRALCRAHGPAGYGVWWAVVEMLCDSSTHSLNLKPYNVQAIADDVYCEPEFVEHVLNDCIHVFDLFTISADGAFRSPSLDRRIDEFERVREKRIKAGKKSGEARRGGKIQNTQETPVEHGVNTCSTQDEQKRTTVFEYTGVEKTKENNSSSAPDGAHAEDVRGGDAPDFPPDSRKKPKPIKFDAVDMERAVRLAQTVNAIAPGYTDTVKGFSLENWANEFRLIRAIDKRAAADIDAVIEAFPRDSFWATNVRSPKGLRGTLRDGRDRFTAVYDAVTRPRRNGAPPAPRPAGISEQIDAIGGAF